MQEAIRAALRTSLQEDPKTLVFGEDVGRLGGVFRVTDGLQREFDERRVFDTPLSEAGIVGTAVGLGMRGYRPVVEIQFDGFLAPAFNQIVSSVAKMHARTRGAVNLPITIRVPSYGGINGPEHHSESVEAYFSNVAGLKIASPSSPGDAYQLLLESIRDSDPVLFLEPKSRYWAREPADLVHRTADLPRYSSRVVRDGADATLVAWGACVTRCLQVAEFAREDGIEVEVLDLRWLRPLDVDALIAAASRTGRIVVVHEAPVSGGVGAEVSAVLMEHCFDELKAPVVRVGAPDCTYPPSALEAEYLPSADRILLGLQAVLEH
jgi:pyruvate dehydrogenase E1 component beta subunit